MECNVEAVRSTQHSMTLSVDPRGRHSVFGISLRTSVELHSSYLASPVNPTMRDWPPGRAAVLALVSNPVPAHRRRWHRSPLLLGPP